MGFILSHIMSIGTVDQIIENRVMKFSNDQFDLDNQQMFPFYLFIYVDERSLEKETAEQICSL